MEQTTEVVNGIDWNIVISIAGVVFSLITAIITAIITSKLTIRQEGQK